MISFGLPQSPDYITYLIYGILIAFSLLLLKKIRKSKDQKKGYSILLFYLLTGVPFCYMLLGLTFGATHALYGVITYPKYDATIVDSVSKYYKRSNTGNKIYFNYAILELEDKTGNIIRIDSNEGTSEEIIKGKSASISYKDGIIIKKSFWSIVLFIGTILVSILMTIGLSFLFYNKIE